MLSLSQNPSHAGTRGMPLLTEVDQQQLAIWNTTDRPYLHDLYVPQLVAKQAAFTPDAIALVDDERWISYQKLNQRANQLAHYLQAQGVHPGILVGICMERSLDLVVGMLAILKAGGAYVPFDPTYPLDRLSYMLEDSQVPILLTQQSLAAHFTRQETSILCLDTASELLSHQCMDDPVGALSPADLVYVLYTSGSAGRPKGVQITHDSLLNLIYWHRRTFAVTSADRATQVTSPAFDATGWEVWPYLTAGASVYFVDEHTRVEPEALCDFFVSQGITISFLPTALAERAITLEWPITTRLRYLLTGADKLHHYPPAHLPFKLINNYGPTEATVLVTSGEVPPAEHAEGPPSIGRVIDNTQIYILDEQLQPVPIGEVGELHIGGVGLARGYLNRPEYTAEKFILNPFSQEANSRLYKTGDLAYYLPDGQIAFVGRVDHQIKIRGYRIEASEIISQLNLHPAIQTSYVTAREDTPGDKRLVAYLVLKDAVTTTDLQEFLARVLPDYMIPTTFVALDVLPLTANGKIDREALPAPEVTNMLQKDVVDLPETPIEQEIAAIVCTLLGTERIGVNDNFFMLGGHSLLGTQVLSRITEKFGVTLPLHTLFDAPTVRELSFEVEDHLLESVDSMSDEQVQMLLSPSVTEQI